MYTGEKNLETIIARYSDGLMFFINEIVGNLCVAEDLMEDTFAELVFRKGEFRGEASVKTYLYRIGRNKALNYRKKNGRISCVSLESAAEKEDLESLERIVLRREQQQTVHRAMKELPEQYREVLHLLYFQEMSYEEIGKVMKRTGKQVKNLAYRGRQSMKEILERGGFIYEEL